MDYGQDYDGQSTMWCGPNDGGIKRGDRADTGDDQAQPAAGTGPDGSGVPEDELDGLTGHVTADPSALGGGPGASEELGEIEHAFNDGGIDDLTIRSADDPSLGLTGTEEHPSEDWATETGPTQP